MPSRSTRRFFALSPMGALQEKGWDFNQVNFVCPPAWILSISSFVPSFWPASPIIPVYPPCTLLRCFCRFSPFWFFVESATYAVSILVGSSTPTPGTSLIEYK